ncbi:MAG: DNA alkylation repair protein [Muribaculaceae bacterium]|nr:DNA alkylation repair protein [Muribaculaceae bacterium]
MTSIGKEIEQRLHKAGDETQAKHLMRFFKTGPGQYGEGDRFLGIRVPVTRALVREYRTKVETDDVLYLVKSRFHEVRLAGLLLLIEIYNRAKRRHDMSQREIVDIYLTLLDRGNNWDLVDLVAPKILGDYLAQRPEQQSILDSLAAMENSLWHQRVAIVANWSIIKAGNFDSTFRIVETLLHHPHDLIHKAAGWMLREVGKRGGMSRLLSFLNVHAAKMPRTMLRYAIEQFPNDLRLHYMNLR